MYKAISEMENACLSDDSDRTTVEHIIAQPFEETHDYFRWLKQQAPRTTGMFYDFDAMLSGGVTMDHDWIIEAMLYMGNGHWTFDGWLSDL